MDIVMCSREVEGARLRSELQDVCGHLNVLHGRLVAITREALATDAWHGDGVRSIGHWLAWQGGLSPSSAAKIAAVARRSGELPESTELFTNGLLSLDQIAAIAAHTPPHHDHTAATMARNLTVAQLRKALGRQFFPSPPPAPADPASDAADSANPAAPADSPPPPSPGPGPRHSAWAGFDDAGEFFLHANADPAHGALILKALQEAKDALFHAGHHNATWLDALSEMARRSLDAVPAWARRDRYKVIIHLDAEGAWIHQGPRLPAHLAEQFTCDGTVQPLWYLNGKPVNLGRRQHIIPPQTRIVVENRDRICQHPTCTSIVGLAVHHIRHWTRDRGRTDTSNLICLCAFHHHQLHVGTFTIDGNADQPSTIVFRNHNGDPITGRANPTPPNGTPPPDPVAPYQHPLGGRLDLRWFSYTPAPPPAATRPPVNPEPDSINAIITTIHNRATDTTPGEADHTPNPATGPHAPPHTATNPAA